MQRDKTLLEIDGEPLWQRQLHLLQSLGPDELLVTGPPRDGGIAIQDAQPESGPLAGVVSGLRACSAPLLLVLAVDLPRMTSDYLRQLISKCSESCGLVPEAQPVCAVYPKRALALAERGLAEGDYSMQLFAERCVGEGLVRQEIIAPDDEPLFLNLNTPEDVRALHDV
ncbi:MAG: molybdenum cofactor guanylyltransferase [Verrucomicrobiota bacterium]|nr:molybdenum cofactor guanylyltransferase [Verrucomicrobiota bacterium]